MDEGYFVPKSEILAWVNALLQVFFPFNQINITKIEALGSGSIYCQIFDVIHPGKINLAKVNWKTKNDNDFLANFRLLQTACEKIGIKRHIEVRLFLIFRLKGSSKPNTKITCNSYSGWRDTLTLTVEAKVKATMQSKRETKLSQSSHFAKNWSSLKFSTVLAKWPRTTKCLLLTQKKRKCRQEWRAREILKHL